MSGCAVPQGAALRQLPFHRAAVASHTSPVFRAGQRQKEKEIVAARKEFLAIGTT